MTCLANTHVQKWLRIEKQHLESEQCAVQGAFVHCDTSKLLWNSICMRTVSSGH